MNRISLKQLRLCLLLLIFCIPGCKDDSRQEPARLYVAESGSGELRSVPQADTYELLTEQHTDDLLWFDDRPGRDSGSVTMADFVNRIWPEYFRGYRPNVALAIKDVNGDWSIAWGQINELRQDAASERLSWTITTDHQLETGALQKVILYLDNEGALIPRNQDHVFFQAAAAGELIRSGDEFQLKLSKPLDNLLMLPLTSVEHFSLITMDFWLETIWPESFVQSLPNAAVTIEADGELHSAAVTLSHPEWDQVTQSLTYRAQFMHGSVPQAAGPVFVYIDSYYYGYSDERYALNDEYKVIINNEGYYTIFPASLENYLGWRDAGFYGKMSECLDYIQEVWVDMRPISLRKKILELELESLKN